MAGFRRQLAALDVAILRAVGDEALLDGEPILGAFEWPEPDVEIGKIKTGLGPPRFVVSQVDAKRAVAKESRLVVDLPLPDGGQYLVTAIEPLADSPGLFELKLRSDDERHR